MKHESSGADLEGNIERQYRLSRAHIDFTQQRTRRVALPLFVASIGVVEVAFFRSVQKFSVEPISIQLLIVSGLALAVCLLFAGYLSYRIGMRRIRKMMDSAVFRIESESLVFSVLIYWDLFGFPFTRTTTRRYELSNVVRAEIGDVRRPDKLRVRLKFARKKWLPAPQDLIIPTLENMGDFITVLQRRLPGKITFLNKTLSPWTLRVILSKLAIVAVMITAVVCAVVYGLP